jgi:hypothetical protein
MGWRQKERRVAKRREAVDKMEINFMTPALYVSRGPFEPHL